MQSVVRSSLVGLLALASLTACGDKVTVPITTTTAPSVVHSVTVTPASIPSLAVGSSVTLAASVDADAAVTVRTVTWSSSDATVATVDATGKVTGVKAGTVTIIAAATADPNVKGSALVTVGGGAAVTVSISTINQTVCGVVVVGQPPICNSVPANTLNIHDQVDVTLNVDAGGQALKSITAMMKCGNDSVTQVSTFSANVAELDANEASAPTTVSFNTAAFTPAGVVALHNGQCSISASAVTASGTQSATTTQQFTLNNADMAVLTVQSTNSATDPLNRPWIGGGTFTVTALPIMYSGRTPVSAAIGITPGTITVGSIATPNPATQTISTLSAGAFSASWTTGSSAPTVRGFAATGNTPTVNITDNSGAVVTTVGSVTVKGGTFTNTPADKLFNLDEQKPAPGTFSLVNNPDQGVVSGAATGYIGTAFRFAADSAAGYRGANAVAGNQIANTDNGGVDKVTVQFQFANNVTGAAFTTVTNTTAIAQSETSTAYKGRMITVDAVGNADTTAFATTFGVDKTVPTIDFGAAPANQATTITTGSLGNFVVTVGDGLSGPGTSLVAQVRQWNGPTSVSSTNEGRIDTNLPSPGAGVVYFGVGTSGSTAQNPCYVGRFNATQAASGPNALPVLSATGTTLGFCTPVPYNLNLGLPATRSVDGYWYTTVVATDVAGNQAAPVNRVVLEDITAPVVGAPDLPGSIVGNATVSFPTPVTDTVTASVGDIVGSYITENFPGASLRFATTAGPGVAFDNTLTNSTTITPTLTNFIKNLHVGAAPAAFTTAENTTGVTISAIGAAQNIGSFPVSFTGGIPALTAGSTATLVGTGMTNWSIATPTNATVSNCINDTCTPPAVATQPTSVTLTVTATGPTATFANPFSSGTVQFWYRPTGNAVWYLLGASSAGNSRDNGVNRFWDYTVSFNPPNFTPDQVALTTAGMTIEVVAVGINTAGDAIMSPAQTITIANP